MSDRTAGLLLKAVRQLPQDEQDEVLTELLAARLLPAGPAMAASGLFMFPPDLTPEAQRKAIEAMDVKLKVLPVLLPEDDYERLRSFAAEQGFSMAVVVRTLVERFLNRRGPGPQTPP